MHRLRTGAGSSRGSDAARRDRPGPRQSLTLAGCLEPQLRRLALTQGLAVETGTVGAGREVSPHSLLGQSSPQAPPSHRHPRDGKVQTDLGAGTNAT